MQRKLWKWVLFILISTISVQEDGGLHFCINFYKLNARTKKDSHLLHHIQEAIESLVGAGYFFCLDLEAGFWQIAKDEALKKYTAFTVGNL